MAPQFFILVALALTSLVLAAALFLGWRSFDRKPHALLWSAAFFLGAVQWSVNLAGSLFADRAIYWLVVNAIPLGILSFALAGHRIRIGRRPRWGLLIACAVVVEALVAWFTAARPHVGLNMAVQPAYAGLVMLAVAWTITRRSRALRAAEWGASAVNLAFGLILLAGAGAALAQGAAGDPYWLGWYLRINFLAMPTGYVATGVFAVFLLASDLSEAMRELARTDQLTAVYNRRGFEAEAQRAMARARERGMPLAVVIGDIDRFKAINDALGHDAGDTAIKGFAQTLARAARGDAFVARLGGEEFVIVMPDADLPRATEVAEAARAALAAAELWHAEQPIRLTASFGVAGLAAADRDVYDVLKRADAALYRAKEDGRNRIAVAG